MKRFLLLILCLTFAGCASQDRYYLNGKTQAQFYQDCEQCTAIVYNSGNYNKSGEFIGQGAASGNGTVAGLGAVLLLLQKSGDDAQFCRCLAQRGYTKVK